MAFLSFRQNRIRSGGAALGTNFSYFRHDLIPRRVNLFIGRNQQGGGAAITDDLHSLTTFRPVKHRRSLLVQLF